MGKGYEGGGLGVLSHP